MGQKKAAIDDQRANVRCIDPQNTHISDELSLSTASLLLVKGSYPLNAIDQLAYVCVTKRLEKKQGLDDDHSCTPLLALLLTFSPQWKPDSAKKKKTVPGSEHASFRLRPPWLYLWTTGAWHDVAK